MSMKLFQKGIFLFSILIIIGQLLGLLHSSVQKLQIRENQLQFNGFNISDGVYGTVHMDYIVIFEATHHMHNGIRFPDISQELVSQAFSLGSAPNQPRNIHKLDNRRSDFFRMIQVRQKFQALIRHRHYAYIGVNSTEGVVGRLRPRLGNGIKEGGLSHIWQTDNS